MGGAVRLRGKDGTKAIDLRWGEVERAFQQPEQAFPFALRGSLSIGEHRVDRTFPVSRANEPPERGVFNSTERFGAQPMRGRQRAEFVCIHAAHCNTLRGAL